MFFAAHNRLHEFLSHAPMTAGEKANILQRILAEYGFSYWIVTPYPNQTDQHPERTYTLLNSKNGRKAEALIPDKFLEDPRWDRCVAELLTLAIEAVQAQRQAPR